MRVWGQKKTAMLLDLVWVIEKWKVFSTEPKLKTQGLNNCKMKSFVNFIFHHFKFCIQLF